MKIKKRNCMKSKFFVIIGIFILLTSCGFEDDDKESNCYLIMSEKMDLNISEYELQISEIRDSDNSWSTHEQCVEQHDVAQIWHQKMKDAYENTDWNDRGCSESEIRELKSRLVAFISELDADVNINYNCGPGDKSN
ncbi:MAG TPA: hypothetical protein VIN10_08225 [Bacteroidales bacterium]